MIEALVLISLLIVLVVSAAVLIYCDNYGYEGPWLFSLIGTFLSGAILPICLLTFTADRVSNYANLARLEALRTSYELMEERGQNLDSVAVYAQIMEMNKDLAYLQRLREMGFTWRVPKEYEDARPITPTEPAQ